MVEVERGDPHNDQTAAMANEQLDNLLESTRRMRAAAELEGADEVQMMVVAATTMAKSGWSEMKFSSLLAAALLRLTREP